MNRNLKLNVVSAFTCRILKDSTGDDYDYENFLIKLLVNGKESVFTLVAAFKEKDRSNVYKEIIYNNMQDINDIQFSEAVRVITLYNEKFSDFESISFDKKSEFPIQAMFEDGSFEEVFFNKFIDFRNNLIRNRQVIKSDDIYQFYLSITGRFIRKVEFSDESKTFRSKLRKIFVKK